MTGAPVLLCEDGRVATLGDAASGLAKYTTPLLTLSQNPSTPEPIPTLWR